MIKIYCLTSHTATLFIHIRGYGSVTCQDLELKCWVTGTELSFSRPSCPARSRLVMASAMATRNGQCHGNFTLVLKKYITKVCNSLPSLTLIAGAPRLWDVVCKLVMPKETPLFMSLNMFRKHVLIKYLRFTPNRTRYQCVASHSLLAKHKIFQKRFFSLTWRCWLCFVFCKENNWFLCDRI